MARDTSRTDKLTDDTQNGNNEDLQQQIAQLKEDLASIAATLTTIGTRKVQQAKQDATNAYGDAYEQGEDIIHTLKDRAASMEEQITDYVQDRPITSLAIAAGIGYLFSALTRR